MTPAQIEAYLHREIPISAAMGVRVRACDRTGATLAAPLGPNINHHATAFGGSVSAVAIITAWTWVHVALHTAGQSARLVIQGNRVAYLAPILGDFEAQCSAPAAAEFEKFLRTLGRHEKARIALTATVRCGGIRAATFSGDYVAVRSD